MFQQKCHTAEFYIQTMETSTFYKSYKPTSVYIHILKEKKTLQVLGLLSSSNNNIFMTEALTAGKHLR